MPQHTHEPIFYRSAVEIFDDVKNSSRSVLHVLHYLPRPKSKPGLAFQEHNAVLCLTADLHILIEIANVTARRGNQNFEFCERVTKPRPRIRMKFTDYVCVTRQNLFRTFQNTDFCSFRIDFHATRCEPVLRQIRIESDNGHSNLFGFVRGGRLDRRRYQRRLGVAPASVEYRLTDSVRAGTHFNHRPFDTWIETEILHQDIARVGIRFNSDDATGLTTLRRHQNTIRSVVRAHIDSGVTFLQMVAEPRDLQCIISGDAVGRARIAQPNWASARHVTQRVPFDPIRLPASAVKHPLQLDDNSVPPSWKHGRQLCPTVGTTSCSDRAALPNASCWIARFRPRRDALKIRR